jgi:hypothetical protein
VGVGWGELKILGKCIWDGNISTYLEELNVSYVHCFELAQERAVCISSVELDCYNATTERYVCMVQRRQA